MSEGRGGVQIFCFFFLKKENRGGFYFGSFSKRTLYYSNIYKYVQLFILSLIIEGARMEESKNITLKVNTKLYDKYRELCKHEGWIVSRQFEKCMEEELKKRGQESGD